MLTLKEKLKSLLEQNLCPACHNIDTLMIHSETEVTCQACHYIYPIVHNIPLLFDENQSVFSFKTVQNSEIEFVKARNSYLRSLIKQLTPSLGVNRVAFKNFQKLKKTLLQNRESKAFNPKVLVIGGSIEGRGIQQLLSSPELEIIETDVVIGPRTQIICDAHQIPYQEEVFDCIITQAVLEHVIDPFQCVKEFHRVLKPNGLVYMEVPFMQQVHGEAYDFMRFSSVGLRTLFRHFEEIDSGVTTGPGSVMAWSYEHLLLSLFGYSEGIRLFLKTLARFTGFWLKYLDIPAQWNPLSKNSASELYFLGKKTPNFYLTDKQLIDYYYKLGSKCEV